MVLIHRYKTGRPTGLLTIQNARKKPCKRRFLKAKEVISAKQWYWVATNKVRLYISLLINIDFLGVCGDCVNTFLTVGSAENFLAPEALLKHFRELQCPHVWRCLMTFEMYHVKVRNITYRKLLQVTLEFQQAQNIVAALPWHRIRAAQETSIQRNHSFSHGTFSWKSLSTCHTNNQRVHSYTNPKVGRLKLWNPANRSDW